MLNEITRPTPWTVIWNNLLETLTFRVSVVELG